ncbi:MAG: hypothetical protein IPN96_13215 [Anaerolineales bacterium]|nr:hypothetical protein [Anaerolineales bacterium]MBK8823881.1 hypothetical protein [Anaerolineales bacterium]
MDSEDPLIFRVGMFFYVIGGGAFVLFVASDLAEQADFDYLFVAIVIIGIGWVFRRGMTPPPSAGRFAWLKTKIESARKKKETKIEAKKK